MPTLQKPPALPPHPAFSRSGAGKKGSSRPTHGEPLVWLTSLGLTMGLLMVVALLAVVVWNGLNVFWPKPVAVVTLRPQSSESVGGSKTFAGIVTKHQEKIIHLVRGQSVSDKDESAADKPDSEEAKNRFEWQFYTGNKDQYGLGFKFVDHADIQSMTYPKDVMVVERLEYGNAIAEAVLLRETDGSEIPVSDPSFHEKLTDRVLEASRRRAQIYRIEKSQIGALNARMRELSLKKQELEKTVAQLVPANRTEPELLHEREAIEYEEKTLQTRYETLAAEARKIRESQNASVLRYRLLSGQEKDLPIGQVVRFYYPNRMDVAARLKHFWGSFWRFLTEEPREANTEGGIFPAIFGTFVMTLLMSLAVTPFGVIAAIYLREYAKQGLWVRMVRIAVNNLAGVPSIVFGVFGLGFFVYFVGGSIDKLFFGSSLPTPTFGTGGVLWAALTLALMTVPVVIVATEESLASVPRGVREGSLACGASKWQTIRRVVLPAAAPGIMTGFILAMARGAGEVAPLMMVGVVKLAPTLPIDGLFPFLHLERKFMHLGFHIYDLGFQSPDSEAAKPMVFATTLVLILLILALNLTAVRIRQNLRKKYALSAV